MTITSVVVACEFPPPLLLQLEAKTKKGGEEAGGVGKRLEGWGRGWRGEEEAGGVGKEAGGVRKRLEGWGRGWRDEEEAGGVGKRLEMKKRLEG